MQTGTAQSTSPRPAELTAPAFARVRRSAKAGDAAAALMLGRCYEKGWLVEISFDQAMAWYLKAAEGGEAAGVWRALAIANVATLDASQKEFLRAELEQRAAAENHQAQVWLAWTLQHETQDFQAAEHWYLRSAAHGNADAAYNLGLMYQRGTLGKKDLPRAQQYFDQAASQSHPRAQLMLGLMLSRGDAGPPDATAAINLYQRAAQAGYAKAQYNLGIVLAGGDGVVQDDDAAARWFKAAARQGYAKAQFALGNCYRRGLGLEACQRRARRWLWRAARNGYSRAQYRLAQELSGESGDMDNARHWFTLAAEQGMASAQYRLARLLLHHALDLTEAVGWLERSAAQSYPRAKFWLARCYQRGHGVGKDRKAAYRLLCEAEAAGYERARRSRIRLEEKLGAPLVDQIKREMRGA